MKKRLITTILATTIALAITACGGNTNETTQTADAITETATEVAEQTTDIATDTVTDESTNEFGDFKVLSWEEIAALSDDELYDYGKSLKGAKENGVIDEDTYNKLHANVDSERFVRDFWISTLEERINAAVISTDLGNGYGYYVVEKDDGNGGTKYVCHIINTDLVEDEVVASAKEPLEFADALDEAAFGDNGVVKLITSGDANRQGLYCSMFIDKTTQELYIAKEYDLGAKYHEATNLSGTETRYFTNYDEITEQEYRDAMGISATDKQQTSVDTSDYVKPEGDTVQEQVFNLLSTKIAEGLTMEEAIDFMSYHLDSSVHRPGMASALDGSFHFVEKKYITLPSISIEYDYDIRTFAEPLQAMNQGKSVVITIIDGGDKNSEYKNEVMRRGITEDSIREIDGYLVLVMGDKDIIFFAE